MPGWRWSNPPNIQFRLNRDSPQARGLVAWWPALASRVGPLRELVNRLNGTLNGQSYINDSSRGTVVDFPGNAGESINAGSSPLLRLQSHSWSAWVTIDTFDPSGLGSDLLFSRCSDITTAGYEWGIRNIISEGPAVLVFAYYDSDIRGWYRDSTTISLSTRYHLGGRWNREAGEVSFFIDGRLSSTVATTTGTINHNASDDFLIGDQPQNREFDGKLDDLRIANVLWSDRMFLEIYNNPWELYEPIAPQRVWVVAGATTEFITPSGAVTATGAIAWQAQAFYAGNDTPLGAIIRDVITAYAGQSAPTGQPNLGAQTSLSGSATPTGSLLVVQIIVLSISGAITATGNLIKSIATSFVGQVDPNGQPIKDISTTLAGSVTATGALTLVSSALKITKALFKGMFKGMFKGIR